MLKTIVPARLEFKDGVPYSAARGYISHPVVDGVGYRGLTALNRLGKAGAMENLVAASNFLCVTIEITLGQVWYWR